MKSGSLNFLEPSGLVMGLLYLFNDTNSPVHGNLKTTFTVPFIICSQNSTFHV
jgi:hypothetical protein